MFDFVFDFGAFWVPFWSHFGTPSRPFWESIFALFLEVGPRAPQERPKSAPRGPKRLQKLPREAPRRPLRGPESNPGGSREAPRGLKRSQKGAKTREQERNERTRAKQENESETRPEIEANKFQLRGQDGAPNRPKTVPKTTQNLMQS